MRSNRLLVLASIVFALALAAPGARAQSCPPTSRVLKVDAVELLRGKEVAGDEAIFVDRGRHRYLFASAENKAAFEREAERHEIQLGGSCARMGPLSGEGTADLFAVHEGRIYVFASPGCKATFQKDPARFLEGPDAPVTPADAASAQRAEELLDKATDAMGGAQALAGVRTLRAESERTVESGGKAYKVRKALLARFPGCFRVEESWDGKGWATVCSETGAFFDLTEPYEMAASQRAAFEREMARDPLVALLARARPDFRAAHVGAAKAGGTPVELVAVSFAGSTTTFGIDPATGRVLLARYKGRGPRLTMGEVEVVHEDFADAGGVTLAKSARFTFEGERAAGMDREWDGVRVNEGVEEEGFRMGAGKG